MAVKMEDEVLTDGEVLRRIGRDDMHAAWMTAAILVAGGMDSTEAAEQASLLRQDVDRWLVKEYRGRM